MSDTQYLIAMLIVAVWAGVMWFVIHPLYSDLASSEAAEGDELRAFMQGMPTHVLAGLLDHDDEEIREYAKELLNARIGY